MKSLLYNSARVLIFFATFCLMISCDKKADDLWESEKLRIRNYLTQQGIYDYVEDANSGFFYYFTDLDSISGGRPNVNSKVEIKYSAEDMNGVLYHQTLTGETEIIDLSKSIVGWQLAFPYFYIGSKVTLLLPSRLAYGKKGYKDANNNEIIPPNVILIFKIEMVEVHPHF